MMKTQQAPGLVASCCCRGCGFPLDPTDRFCGCCGTMTANNTGSNEQQQAAPAQHYQPAAALMSRPNPRPLPKVPPQGAQNNSNQRPPLPPRSYLPSSTKAPASTTNINTYTNNLTHSTQATPQNYSNPSQRQLPAVSSSSSSSSFSSNAPPRLPPRPSAHFVSSPPSYQAPSQEQQDVQLSVVSLSSWNHQNLQTVSERPGDSDKEKLRILEAMEQERKKIEDELRDKRRDMELKEEEEKYIKERQREHLDKLKRGEIGLGPKRETVYIHRVKSQRLVSLEFADQAIIQTHEREKYVAYKIVVRWGECMWTIFRRYKQFSDFDQSVRWKTKIKLQWALPPKKLLGHLDEQFIEERKEGLKRYVQGVEEQQLEFLNEAKYEQVFIRFFGPMQIGDIKDHVPKLPFKVQIG